MPKCRRAAALGRIVLPMNNCPSCRALGQRRPCHLAGIRDGSSEEKAVSSAQVGKGLRDAGVDEWGRKYPRPIYQGSICMLTQEGSELAHDQAERGKIQSSCFLLFCLPFFMPSSGLLILKSSSFLNVIYCLNQFWHEVYDFDKHFHTDMWLNINIYPLSNLKIYILKENLWMADVYLMVLFLQGLGTRQTCSIICLSHAMGISICFLFPVALHPTLINSLFFPAEKPFSVVG